MKIRPALHIYAGLDMHPLSYNEARAACDRLEALLRHRGWGVDELRRLIAREALRAHK